MSDRVRFCQPEREVPGWALNISRGGLRAILEASVELGAEFQITIGDSAPRPGRIVWIQDEPDGAIVGVAFLDNVPPDASVPPPPTAQG